ncbi:hypothetical protein [Methylobacterium aquaticum]|uniref:Uncharacterized protein n=1 Tax=Methylobacterium aquaticum TaxID=270351 RepID=A0A0J6V5V2_9HYPH|nr:hypothetical protein [Methylobacterium aquaticum]KMO34291.1 hypothetical protein VP06_14555 [Methylobacterium aquaticum]
MLIHALDPATRCGWALGPAGETPQSGAIVLKQPGQDLAHACLNMAAHLRGTWRVERPQLVIFEKPMDPHVWFSLCKRTGQPQNAASLSLQHRLAGVIECMCGLYEIQCEGVDRQAVLKFFTGKRSWGGREEGKKAVIERCQALTLIPKNSRDDDRADAVANHAYASAIWGRARPRELTLFGQTA